MTKASQHEEAVTVEVESLQSCDKCDYEADDISDLRNHNAKNVHDVKNKNKTITEEDKQRRCSNVTLVTTSLVHWIKWRNMPFQHMVKLTVISVSMEHLIRK